MSIVCLVGSTRFQAAFHEANRRESLAGNIVLMLGCTGPAGCTCNDEEKVLMNALHMQKIDMADEVLVLNVGGYVGEQTRKEIEYARRTGCGIRWLEEEVVLASA